MAHPTPIIAAPPEFKNFYTVQISIINFVFPVALPVSKDCFAVGDNCPMLHKNIMKINFSTGWGVSGLGLAPKNNFLSIFGVNLEFFFWNHDKKCNKMATSIF